MATTRIPFPSARPVYKAAERWRDHCLLADGTLFPEVGLFSDDTVATLANGESLVRDFVERPDTGEEWVRRIREHAVLPVPAEHFHGFPDELAEFDLDHLRKKVDPTNEDTAAAGAGGD